MPKCLWQLNQTTFEASAWMSNQIDYMPMFYVEFHIHAIIQMLV